MACSFCYARRIYERFHLRSDGTVNPTWDYKIRFVPKAFEELCGIGTPSRIFVGSTMELFGDWVKPEWLELIFDNCRFFNQHTFLFLTKKPDNLARWSPFPPNCWIGVSVTDYLQANHARYYLWSVKASVKFLSVEPLLSPLEDRHCCQLNLMGTGISWVIIGRQTPVSKKTEPKIEWIEEIETACKEAGIPYFEKNNLKSLLKRDLVQEFPQGKLEKVEPQSGQRLRAKRGRGCDTSSQRRQPRASEGRQPGNTISAPG